MRLSDLFLALGLAAILLSDGGGWLLLAGMSALTAGVFWGFAGEE